MGRPGLAGHRKFRRLSRDVGCPAIARGSLELLWDSCYEAGDDYLGDVSDVESAAHWQGEPGVLVKALLDAGGEGELGFIEEIADRAGHFICHDLYDHAPEYVKKRFDREADRKAKGVTLRELRSKAGKASGESRRPFVGKCGHTGTNGEHMMNTCQTNGTTPSPSPSPSPIKNNNPLPPTGSGDDVKSSRKASWLKAHPSEVIQATKEIKAIWPRPEDDAFQPDGKTLVPGVSPSELASRLAEVAALGADLSVCVKIAARVVSEWKTGKWIKAPQHFFGKAKDSPFRAYYQAHVTNESMKVGHD